MRRREFSRALPLPACGERSDREAIRVRGRLRESERFSSAPHPDPLPASGERELKRRDFLTLPTVRAAKQATNAIPIVMADAGDPVGTGLVASLSRPRGNITGMAGVTAELAGKSVELIREMMPSAQRLAALCNVTDPFYKPFLAQIQLAARTVPVEIQSVMVNGPEEFNAAFPLMRQERIDAVIVQPSLPTKRAAELALKNHLPAVSVPRWFAEEGGLMAYSPRLADLYRQATTYVDKILNGARPADLPVQQPTKFELVINLKTAKALGLAVPPTLLARADEVIE